MRSISALGDLIKTTTQNTLRKESKFEAQNKSFWVFAQQKFQQPLDFQILWYLKENHLRGNISTCVAISYTIKRMASCTLNSPPGLHLHQYEFQVSAKYRCCIKVTLRDNAPITHRVLCERVVTMVSYVTDGVTPLQDKTQCQTGSKEPVQGLIYPSSKKIIQRISNART